MLDLGLPPGGQQNSRAAYLVFQYMRIRVVAVSYNHISVTCNSKDSVAQGWHLKYEGEVDSSQTRGLRLLYHEEPAVNATCGLNFCVVGVVFAAFGVGEVVIPLCR